MYEEEKQKNLESNLKERFKSFYRTIEKTKSEYHVLRKGHEMTCFCHSPIEDLVPVHLYDYIFFLTCGHCHSIIYVTYIIDCGTIESAQAWKKISISEVKNELQHTLGLKVSEQDLSKESAAFREILVQIANSQHALALQTVTKIRWNTRKKPDYSDLVLFKKLEELDLRENNLEILPAELEYCKPLKILNISTNTLRSLPLYLKRHPLEILDLTNNRLQEVPAVLGEIKSLNKLYLAKNALQSLKSLKPLIKLEQLSILDLRENSQLGEYGKLYCAQREITSFFSQVERSSE